MEQGNILNLVELLSGSAARLKNIKRFSNSHRIQDESVAEHSFSTALYSLVIGLELVHNGLKFAPHIAAARALLHDIEESHSGDFIRTFKHSSPELSQAIEKANAVFAKKLFQEMAPNVAEVLELNWKTAKDGTFEGRLVEFADYLSVLSYIRNESRLGNRAIVEDNWESLSHYAEKFQHARFDFLRCYEEQAWAILAAIKEIPCNRE